MIGIEWIIDPLNNLKNDDMIGYWFQSPFPANYETSARVKEYHMYSVMRIPEYHV